jgi:DegV family protein with EDD domain
LFKQQFTGVRIEVVDTLRVAMSHGWAAIEAARSALEGLDFESVVAQARDVAQKGTMIQTADTLRYLYMGGRIGRAKHLMGSLLNIKPLIGMEDGIIVALGTARSRLKAYRSMVEVMQQRVGESARVRIAFTHVAAMEKLETLRGMVSDRFECVETIVTDLAPVLAVHSGPGTVGMSFFPL